MTDKPKFSSRLVTLAPAALVDAVEAASRPKLQTASDYVRQALLAQLQRDGI
jgi:hypothetical protein